MDKFILSFDKNLVLVNSYINLKACLRLIELNCQLYYTYAINTINKYIINIFIHSENKVLELVFFDEKSFFAFLNFLRNCFKFNVTNILSNEVLEIPDTYLKSYQRFTAYDIYLNYFYEIFYKELSIINFMNDINPNIYDNSVLYIRIEGKEDDNCLSVGSDRNDVIIKNLTDVEIIRTVKYLMDKISNFQNIKELNIFNDFNFNGVFIDISDFDPVSNIVLINSNMNISRNLMHKCIYYYKKKYQNFYLCGEHINDVKIINPKFNSFEHLINYLRNNNYDISHVIN